MNSKEEQKWAVHGLLTSDTKDHEMLLNQSRNDLRERFSMMSERKPSKGMVTGRNENNLLSSTPTNPVLYLRNKNKSLERYLITASAYYQGGKEGGEQV